MLYGEYQHNIDKKGRLAIPSKLREEFGNEFMICKGIYGKECICVYPMDKWNELVEKISKLPSAKSSIVKRFLYGGAYSVEFDTQGRILIPAALRDYAKLDANAYIIGMDTNLEIWNTELWEKENSEYTPESIADIVKELEF